MCYNNKKMEVLIMAIINCPECGKEISNTAKSCPHCGYDIKKAKNIKFFKKISICVLCLVLLLTAYWGATKGIRHYQNTHRPIDFSTTITAPFGIKSFSAPDKDIRRWEQSPEYDILRDANGKIESVTIYPNKFKGFKDINKISPYDEKDLRSDSNKYRQKLFFNQFTEQFVNGNIILAQDDLVLGICFYGNIDNTPAKIEIKSNYIRISTCDLKYYPQYEVQYIDKHSYEKY
jgi:ribosomal protein L37E